MSSQTAALSQSIPQNTTQIQTLVHTTASFIRSLVQKGGPEQTDYPLLQTALQQFSDPSLQEFLSPEDIGTLHNSFGAALSPKTIQGWAFQKPLGYAGDFKIIEKIYNFEKSSVPHLRKWDEYFHAQKAPQAVRNRLSFFLDQLYETKTQNPSATQVLNVASGPGRDMFEALRVIGSSGLRIDCVDQDNHAIEFAKTLCQDFLHMINFTHKNIFQFHTQNTYHLIWSAGLFDYFNDNLFKRTIRKLSKSLKPNGRMVIGNFSPENPTRGYMELCNWKLIHRSKEHLRQLAKECGFQDHQISVEQEAEGINLFLILSN